MASSRDNEDVDSDDKDESVDDFSDEISTNTNKKTILTSGQIRELHSPLVGFVALAVQLPSDFLT